MTEGAAEGGEMQYSLDGKAYSKDIPTGAEAKAYTVWCKVVATKTVKAGATSVTVKGLKSGKTYYVRVRPYRVKSSTTYTGVISGWRTAKAKWPDPQRMAKSYPVPK